MTWVDRDALIVAMCLVPGMYARNRFFAFHREPEVRRAKARAATIRGVVRQLAGERGEVEGFAMARHGETTLVRFRLPQASFERRLELSDVERACLLFLATRAGVNGVHMTHEESAHIDAALKRLGAEPEARARPSEWPPR
jgi:hypothetical protein